MTATGQPLLPPYAIKKVAGVKVGFIGMTLEGTKEIVSQEGVAGLDFADEADTANRYAAELRAQGVQTIIVLLHEGGFQAGNGGAGAQIQCLLEQQFQVNRTLYLSSTVSYTVDTAGVSARPNTDPCAGSRVIDSSVAINGTAIQPGATYRVTVNNFLAGGGDGFSVLRGGTNAVTGMIDLDALTAYLGANSPVSAPALNRIRTTAGVPAA